jgi:hypothetical protein
LCFYAHYYGGRWLRDQPKSNLQAVVRDSPAFRLVKDAKESLEYEAGGPEVLRDLRMKLFRLFQGGKASPTDVYLGGQTVFHVSTYLRGHIDHA